jgi:putative Mg2+ transporter-C (MgtC) family protein
MAYSELALRLAVAALCGAVIGFEREQQQKPAGLRTHMLVALGSAAFTVGTLNLEQLAGPGGNGPPMQIDPARIIQGIAGGIGFLGAGSIMRTNGSVQGLTTAATIWVVGAVGICCGLGNYVLAAITSIFAVSITSMMGFVESWLFSHVGYPAPTEPPSRPAKKASADAADDETPGASS